jgi:hypothetical protein
MAVILGVGVTQRGKNNQTDKDTNTTRQRACG